MFWRPKNKKLLSCIISTIPDSYNEHFSFNTSFVPWGSYLLCCLNSAFAEASLFEEYNAVCSFKWFPFFLSLQNWTSKIYNRLWKNYAKLAVLFLKEGGSKWPQRLVNEVNINLDVQAFLQNILLSLVKRSWGMLTNFPQIIEANKNKHTCNQVQSSPLQRGKVYIKTEPNLIENAWFMSSKPSLSQDEKSRWRVLDETVLTVE